MTTALSMEDTSQKMRDPEVIRQMQPASTDHFVVFMNYLADRLGKQSVVPQGFVMCVTLALHDLNKGVNGYTGLPIKNRLVGVPSIVPTMMLQCLFRHLHLILPKDFAEEVLAIDAQVRADVARSTRVL